MPDIRLFIIITVGMTLHPNISGGTKKSLMKNEKGVYYEEQNHSFTDRGNSFICVLRH